MRNYGEFANRGVGRQGTWQQYYADSQILEGKATGPLPQPTDQRQWHADVPSLDAITNHEYPPLRHEHPGPVPHRHLGA